MKKKKIKTTVFKNKIKKFLVKNNLLTIFKIKISNCQNSYLFKNKEAIDFMKTYFNRLLITIIILFLLSDYFEKLS